MPTDPQKPRMCTACGVEKKEPDFPSRISRGRPCRVGRCRICERERVQAYRIRRWGQTQKRDPFFCTGCSTQKTIEDFYLACRGHTWSQCKTCVAASRRKQKEADPLGVAQRNREARLRLCYGMTTAGYAELLSRQGGGCAICGARENARKPGLPLPVDHCHKSGQVRGILCDLCNQGLGSFADSVDKLLNAAAYLRASKAVARA